jgi:hypothetical protein
MKRIVITGYNDRNDGPSSFINSLSEGLQDFYCIYNIKSTFGNNDFKALLKSDIVIFNSNNFIPLLVMVMLILVPRKKLISIIHGNGRTVSSSFIFKILLKLNYYVLLRMVDDVIFVSDLQKNNFISRDSKRCSNNSHVIPNGVNLDLLNRLSNYPKTKTIIYAGGESFEKGREFLSELIERISADKIFDNYNFIAFGMNENLKYNTGHLSVEFVRKIDHEEFLNCLAKSVIFLSLSKEETFGIACLESICLKNKIVCYKECGFLHYVNSANTFVVDKYNVCSFFEKLRACANAQFFEVPSEIYQYGLDNMILSYKKVIEGN